MADDRRSDDRHPLSIAAVRLYTCEHEAVRGALTRPRHEAGGDPTLDEELSAVECPMVRATHDCQVVRIAIAAFGAQHQVVHIQEHSLPQPGTTQRPPSRRMTSRRTAGVTSCRAFAECAPTWVIGFRCCASHCAISTISEPTSTSSPRPCCQP